MTAWLVPIEITERGRDTRRERIATLRAGEREVVYIGRCAPAQLRLPFGNVSKRHAMLIVRGPDDVVVCDAGSTNGTQLNGRWLRDPHRLCADDRIYLGDVAIRLAGPAVAFEPVRVTLRIVGRTGGPAVETYACRWVADDHHELTFGRAGDVKLDSANVSRVHCMLIVNEAGRVWAADRGSSNGTFIDGKRIGDRARFAIGQRLHVGNFAVQLVEPPHVPASFEDA